MNKIFKILAPVSNVNDTSVVVYEFLVENYSIVTAGQDVMTIETSKTTKNLIASAAGYIRFLVNIGDEVSNGHVLAIVADNIDVLNSYQGEAVVSNSMKTISNKKGGLFGIYNQAVTLGETLYQNGEKVEKGSVLCKIRSNQGVQSVLAPYSGYVFWNKKSYDTVIPGENIGIIEASDISDDIINYKNTDEIRGLEITKYGSIRISKAANQILKKENLSAESLGLSGLVTVNAVLNKFDNIVDDKENRDNSLNLVETFSMKCDSHISSGRYEKLSKSKRSEANFLSAANKDAIVSQVSVLVPTKGIFSQCAKDSDLAERFSAIIILETSKLLKKYKKMTAIYENGGLYVYDEINVGYALSLDDGLKVPVYRNSDQKDLETIIREKEIFIEKYISGGFLPEDLSGGTFTITDLSSTGCFMFNPVLNFQQSAILGIGGENSTHTDYPLILAFDHRVIEGAVATEFLCELRERLIAHENVLLGKSKTQMEHTFCKSADFGSYCDNLCCESCFRTVEEIEKSGNYLFKVLDKSGKEKHICSICVRGW